MNPREKKLHASQWLILALAAIGAGAMWDPTDWQPIELFGSLLVLSIAGEVAAMKVGLVRISPSFLAIGLGMALLGPVPAAAIGILGMLGPSLHSRISPQLMLNNVATYATFPLLGGALIEGIAEPTAGTSATFLVAAVVFAVYLATNFLNFAMIVGYLCARDGDSLVDATRKMFLPVFPWELATAGVTVATVVAYQELGVAAVGVMAMMLFIYQLLLKAVVAAERQRDELKEQMGQLIELHDGVLQVMVETLSLRDRGTARHAAAVARFARATAEAAGLSEADQQVAHMAGLLHDIGKFEFPDHVLKAETLTPEDWQLIRRHPTQGAAIVRRVRGFEAVADVIEAHHERPDGSGYPLGLEGDEIPLLSRIVSVADTFDVMTARDSYRQPMCRVDAIAELRRVAGTQLDSELVAAFIGVIERGVGFAHGDDADFETELHRTHDLLPGRSRQQSAATAATA